MKRVIILMMDSFGIGGAADAAKFGDEGANTLASVAKLNNGLKIPNLISLGLVKAAEASAGVKIETGPQPPAQVNIPSKYGFMREQSHGKDTLSGHWEMAGVPVLFDWGYFKPGYPSFPKELIEQICKEAGIDKILGNKAASGTEILEELGEEHIKTGKPICYTSADSVFQIAAHEKHFGLERLYTICEIAFKYLKPYKIARVIARPFEGERKGEFKRTKNRHDYAVKPPAPTVLDFLKENGGNVISIGKINDIYAKQGITKAVKASGLEELWNTTIEETKNASGNSIIFTNFVDFDMVWGHRRDFKGYAGGLEYFDSRLPELANILQEGDLVFITADHGCDPSYKGTDHTRENVPAIMFGKNVKNGFIGGRETYSDLGQTVAEYLGITKLNNGTSFL
ncbi:Phosphopentomutase [Elusimicrobium minutum Pei191]|uniref:Phosphopentomutase n=1 Tax=Elusimicrobium minutum (strain Pei191) TaxID=445932 RepID=DEOB_ELUMP|nr:phosphopentomutase [Elusimicrobium minutum]B2KBT7.1 RecName: Full=Phosphopentomutase; AltName: Full=Phosphodeoxyribomutase [Elusimicrobium minutum Pei191]ACC97841.1 Phosphopentomutase [Elusimicrobium minutum Pei191]